MRQHRKKDKGQGLVEYALILVMVAVVVVLILVLLGPTVGNLFSNVTSEVNDATSLVPLWAFAL